MALKRSIAKFVLRNWATMPTSAIRWARAAMVGR